MAKLYKLITISDSDKTSLKKLYRIEYPNITPDKCTEIDNFITGFEITTKNNELKGAFGTFYLNKEGRQGLYGYVLDRIYAHFKFGDDLS